MQISTGAYLGQSEYFRYLQKRGRGLRLLRRILMSPILRFFQGRVLDIGAGIGEFLEAYSDAVGIDINRDCVEYCISKGLNCLQADAYHLPFSADFFDGVLLNNVLEHLDRPEEAFAEIRRVLKHGGRICIEVPGRKGYDHDRTHVRFWGKDETISFLRERGFRDISSGYFPVPCAWAGDMLTHNKLRVFARIEKEDMPEQVFR